MSYGIFASFFVLYAYIYWRVWRRRSDTSGRRPDVLTGSVIARSAVRTLLTAGVLISASYFVRLPTLWLVLGLTHAAVALGLICLARYWRADTDLAEADTGGRDRLSIAGHLYRAILLGLWVYSWWPVLLPEQNS